MKTLLIAVFMLIAICVNAQQDKDARTLRATDTLIAQSDTLVVDTLTQYANKVYLMVQDTGATYTDSVVVETWNAQLQLWFSVGMVNMTTKVACANSNTPNANTMYELNINHFDIIRQRLINTGAGSISGKRVLTSLMLVQSY